MTIAAVLRTLVLALAAIGVAAAGTALAHDRPGLALLGLLLPMFGHGAVLGAEFVLAAWVHRGDPPPRATPGEMLRAWAVETWTALVVFGWRQAFRATAEPDHLPPQAHGRRGVLLVHGYFCNRGIWGPWLRRLRALDVPCVAVDLEPAFGPIEAYAAIVDAGVRRLRDATGVAPLVVAHSMGGLAVREWLARTGRAGDVHAVMTIGTPHRGTWLARFAFTENARQMRLDGPWVSALAQREPPAPERPPMTCFYGHCDNIVFPPDTATRPGADNRHLRGVAHVDMAYRAEVFDAALQLLRAPARDQA